MKKKRAGKTVQAIKPACMGLAVGTVALAAVYTEAVTTLIARRRSSLASRVTAQPGKKKDGQLAEECRQIAEAAGQARRLPTEEVSLVNRDGLTLRAHWYHAAQPKRLLILVHGWHSTWDRDFGMSMPFYHEHDCELLLIEQRCHGSSEGKMISYGDRERYDVLGWLDYAQSAHPELPIYLCGLSMGAATVLLCAGESIADRVTAIVADCGYTVPETVVAGRARKQLGRATDVTLAAVNLNCRLRGGFTLKSCSTTEAMKKNTSVPVLFIHGDSDELVPCSMSLENYLACAAPRELLIVHGAGHARSFLVDPDTYKSRVLAFFDAWDGRLKHPTDSERSRT